MTTRLPDATRLGPVALRVTDLDRSIAFYERVLGFRVLARDGTQVSLGIEVYADRPRATWRRIDGELVMGTDPVDVQGLVAAAGPMPWEGMPSGTVMGHLHLHVGALEAASTFYHDVLGFDRMVWSYPGALFLGAGGYHHHLGTNVWAGPTACPAATEEARLLEWTIVVPSAAERDGVADRLARAGACVTRDPWGTALRLSASY